MTRLSGHVACPCGSGGSYAGCCYDKAFDWVEGDTGRPYQVFHVPPEMATVLRTQYRKFVQRYGREPGPEDPLFFDLPHPEHLEFMVAEAMRRAAIDPAVVYAYETTGRLVTEQTHDLLPDTVLGAWQAAVVEYESEHHVPR